MLLKALYLTSVSQCHLVQQIYHQGMYLSQASYNYCRSKKIYFTIENIFQDIFIETFFTWYPNNTLGEAKDLQSSHVVSRPIHQGHWSMGYVLPMPKVFPNKIGDG